jgi:hypothetical protein
MKWPMSSQRRVLFPSLLDQSPGGLEAEYTEEESSVAWLTGLNTLAGSYRQPDAGWGIDLGTCPCC